MLGDVEETSCLEIEFQDAAARTPQGVKMQSFWGGMIRLRGKGEGADTLEATPLLGQGKG